MMRKYFWQILSGILLLALLASCSTNSQTRLDGVLNLGNLPEDTLYVDGVPQIVGVSVETDGDVVLGYITNDNRVVGQLYGCAYVSLNCGQLYKQGRYEWNYQAPKPTPTVKP